MMTVEQAEGLAARTLAEIDRALPYAARPGCPYSTDTDRQRIASDLTGLRGSLCDCGCLGVSAGQEHHADRYVTGLLLTAAAYGVTL